MSCQCHNRLIRINCADCGLSLTDVDSWYHDRMIEVEEQLTQRDVEIISLRKALGIFINPTPVQQWLENPVAPEWTGVIGFTLYKGDHKVINEALSTPRPAEEVQRVDATMEEAMKAYKASFTKNRRLSELLAEDERKELEGKVLVGEQKLEDVLLLLRKYSHRYAEPRPQLIMEAIATLEAMKEGN